MLKGKLERPKRGYGFRRINTLVLASGGKRIEGSDMPL
jgi:hypothetical protein